MVSLTELTLWVNSSAIFQFSFRSIAVRFIGTGIEQNWNCTGSGMEREWNRTGTGKAGTEREWNWNGVGMEWKWNKNSMDNECSVQGAWPAILLYTS